MHGHSLGGTRKLNRHWQSGGGGGPEENLVFFEREKDVTEWEVRDYANYPYPYLTSSFADYFQSYQPYGSKLPKRNSEGFRPFSILRPGDYQLHWQLNFERTEYISKEGVLYLRCTGKSYNENCGMYAVVMYGLADPVTGIQAPEYIVNGSLAGTKYYVGEAGDYVPDTSGGNAQTWIPFYVNNEIVKYVKPVRTSTSGWLFGCNTFTLSSSNEQPPLIYHIGGKAPFTHYQFLYDNDSREVWFGNEGYFRSPCFQFAFLNNSNSVGAIMTGKIWLERIGDYTSGKDRFLPRITAVPSGYTIKGNGGII